jgi:FkbM family methyltransferase
MKTILKKLIPYKTRMKMRFIQHEIFPTQGDIAEKRQFAVRRAFYSQLLSAGDLCFDVGANTGNRTGVFVALGARVVAVEPQKELCAFLDAKFGNKIKVVRKGVGAKEDTLSLYAPAKYSALATFSKEWSEEGRFKGDGWEAMETVPVTTLDALIAEFGVPKFIKIDTEGYEYQVLQGLSHKIPYLSFEYMTPELNHQAIDCIKRLQAIDGNIRCNFSANESMALNLETWVTPEEMIRCIQTKAFIDTDFGDIYVKSV